MRRSYLLRAGLICSVPCIMMCHAQVAGDAATVNAAYAKLAIAMEVHRLMDRPFAVARGDLVDESTDTAAPVFAISAMKTGPVIDIVDTPLSALVSKPSGWGLQVAVGNWAVRGLPTALQQTTAASADWQLLPYLTEDWNMPFGRVLDIVGPGISSYASFTVDLRFRGHERRYAALFLFGVDGTGNRRVIPIDHIVGSPALEHIMAASLTMGPLASNRYRGRSDVRAFAVSVRGLPGCQPDPVTKLCCDSTSGRCGLAPEASSAAELEREQPLWDQSGRAADFTPPGCADCSVYNSAGTMNVRASQDTTGHTWGQHEASIALTPQCNYSSAGSRTCAPTCHVSIQNLGVSDSGLVWPIGFGHVAYLNFNSIDSQVSGGTCSGQFGVAFQSCVAGICGTSIQIGFPGGTVTFSPSNLALWTFSDGLTGGPCSTVNY